jgi:quercetin 2,3-dioxygenase
MSQTRLSSALDGGDFGWLKAKRHLSVSRAGNPANKPIGTCLTVSAEEDSEVILVVTA